MAEPESKSQYRRMVVQGAYGEPRDLDQRRRKIEECITTCIYHGRHFSPSRDKIVIQKSVDYIIDLFTLKIHREDNNEKGRTGKEAL